jgi:DNA invertase Pin-like site-specific DNA recombinase
MDLGLARVSRFDQNPQLQLDALAKAGCDPVLKRKAGATTAEWLAFRQRAIRQLQPGDTLTTWKLDRLGRSFIDLYDTVKGLHERGITFRSLTENIDLTSPTGELILLLLGWFAEFERAIIIERTRAGKAAMVEQGRHPGGPRTYGLAKDRSTVIEAEAKVLADAATHALHKDPLAKVVRLYNRLRIPAKDGGPWYVSTLRRMLLADAIVPAILTEAQHTDLVSLFANPAERQSQGAPAQHLLSGILECGGCGHGMYVIDLKGRDGAKTAVYRCYRRSDGGPTRGCGMVSIKVDTVEAWMTAAAKQAVCSERFADHLNARRRAVLEGTSVEDLDAMRAELADYQALPPRFRTPDTEARTAALQAEVRKATARLMAAPELGELLDLPRTADGFQGAWQRWDVTERRRKLRLLLNKITVKPAGKGTRFNPSRLDPDWRF